MNNIETILEFLEADHDGCCDDCTSSKTGIQPRQQVNQICNRLAKKGNIRRQRGQCILCHGKKILNIIESPTSAPTEDFVILPSVTTKKVSIEALRNYLDRFCKALFIKYKLGDGSIGLAVLISELSNKDIVPQHQTNMMHIIRCLRNVYVHEHIPMGEGELAIAQAAWEIISKWAEVHEAELWNQSRR